MIFIFGKQLPRIIRGKYAGLLKSEDSVVDGNIEMIHTK